MEMERERLKEGFLPSEGSRGGRWKEIGEEMKRLGYVAVPMAAVTMSFYLLEIVSLIMVGHLGELPLSSAAIAISLAGITGFSFLVLLSLSRIPLFLFFFFLVLFI